MTIPEDLSHFIRIALANITTMDRILRDRKPMTSSVPDSSPWPRHSICAPIRAFNLSMGLIRPGIHILRWNIPHILSLCLGNLIWNRMWILIAIFPPIMLMDAKRNRNLHVRIRIAIWESAIDCKRNVWPIKPQQSGHNKVYCKILLHLRKIGAKMAYLPQETRFFEKPWENVMWLIDSQFGLRDGHSFLKNCGLIYSFL